MICFKVLFQGNLNALSIWSKQWKMPFINTNKCQAIAFNPKGENLPVYHLDGEPLKWVNETVYLGVTVQSNLKYTTHINCKTTKARRILESIKRTLYSAPEKAKLLAYISLCRPILEYAALLWDPAAKNFQYSIEMVQNTVLRFIAGLKGKDSVSGAREGLGIETLEERRDARRTLLFRILNSEECHEALMSSYEELVNDKSNMTVAT